MQTNTLAISHDLPVQQKETVSVQTNALIIPQSFPVHQDETMSVQTKALAVPQGLPAKEEERVSLIDGKLLINIGELAGATGLSIRHLRRVDSCRDIPGRTKSGRRVLFQLEIIREWIRHGMPDSQRWASLQTDQFK